MRRALVILVCCLAWPPFLVAYAVVAALLVIAGIALVCVGLVFLVMPIPAGGLMAALFYVWGRHVGRDGRLARVRCEACHQMTYQAAHYCGSCGEPLGAAQPAQGITQGQRETIFRKLADAVLDVGLAISPCHHLSVWWGRWRGSWVPDSVSLEIRLATEVRSENNAAELYSAVITVILVGLLIAMPRGMSWLGAIALVLAVFRWLEIQTFGLGILLKDEEMSGAYIVSIGVAAVGLGLISAIATVALADGVRDWALQVPSNFGDLMYSSFSNLIVLGNGDYIPASEAAKLIVAFTGVSGVMLLSAYLARTVSRMLPQGGG